MINSTRAVCVLMGKERKTVKVIAALRRPGGIWAFRKSWCWNSYFYSRLSPGRCNTAETEVRHCADGGSWWQVQESFYCKTAQHLWPESAGAHGRAHGGHRSTEHLTLKKPHEVEVVLKGLLNHVEMSFAGLRWSRQMISWFTFTWQMVKLAA